MIKRCLPSLGSVQNMDYKHTFPGQSILLLVRYNIIPTVGTR